jgi:hypothetical protein
MDTREVHFDRLRTGIVLRRDQRFGIVGILYTYIIHRTSYIRGDFLLTYSLLGGIRGRCARSSTG